MKITITIPKSNFLPSEIKGKKLVLRWGTEDVGEDLVRCYEDSLFVSHTYTYELIVTKLIRLRYSLDAELALVNNYLWDSDKYKDEYTEFLEWRSTCKEVARSYLASIEDKASV